MSNTFSSVVRQHWELSLQDNLEKHLVCMELAKMKVIPDGTVLNLPRMAFQNVVNYTTYTPQTAQGLVTANDQLVLNTVPMTVFSMDDLDREDNYIDVVPRAIHNAGYQLKRSIDGAFLNQVLNAAAFYDNGGLNPSTATTPIALTTGTSQNTTNVFGTSRAYLIDAGANVADLALVVDAYTVNTLNTLGLGLTFKQADENYKETLLARGYQGMFLGMEVYLATNLTSTATFTAGATISNGDVVKIKNQTFTFVSSIGSTAGQVLIGASTTASMANLANAVLYAATGGNQGTGAGTTFIALGTEAGNNFLFGITPTASTDTCLFTSQSGAMNVSATMTSGSNVWSTETIHCAIMEKGAINMVLRDNVKIEERQPEIDLVTYYLVYSRYGIVTPYYGKQRMVDVRIQAV